MGKLKSNKSVRKRFKMSKTGKFLRKRAGRRHLLTHKSAKRRRHLRGTDVVPSGMKQTMRRLLPYG